MLIFTYPPHTRAAQSLPRSTALDVKSEELRTFSEESWTSEARGAVLSTTDVKKRREPDADGR